MNHQQNSFSRPASPWPRVLPGVSLLGFILIVVTVNSVTQTHRLLRLGTAVHSGCAVSKTYPKQTDRKQMIEALGPYSVMLQPILDQMPGDNVLSAHRCTIEGHLYMHVIIDHQGKPVSIAITRRDEGDVSRAFFPADSIPARHPSAKPISMATRWPGSPRAGILASWFRRCRSAPTKILPRDWRP